ncbi:hypothetical protein OBJ99_01505 [Empedobacter falsenii]
MKKTLLLFTLFTFFVNAQFINLKIVDYSDKLPIDDVDIYFKSSSRNFVSDLEGKVVIDLSNINARDELIISKKDYQDALVKVADIKTDLTIELEKLSRIELAETLITNLKAEDILEKAIDNYEQNFNVDKYYFLADYRQNILYDSIDNDFLNLDLQFKFDKGSLKIKSNNKLKEHVKVNREKKVNLILSYYFNNLSILEILKDNHSKLLTNFYSVKKVDVSKYSNQIIYLIHLEDDNNKTLITVDKNNFAIVDFVAESYMTQDKGNGFSAISYKFRPHNGKWILKESALQANIDILSEEQMNIGIDVDINVSDYSDKPFKGFNKTINPYKDIRLNFSDK